MRPLRPKVIKKEHIVHRGCPLRAAPLPCHFLGKCCSARPRPARTSQPDEQNVLVFLTAPCALLSRHLAANPLAKPASEGFHTTAGFRDIGKMKVQWFSARGMLSSARVSPPLRGGKQVLTMHSPLVGPPCLRLIVISLFSTGLLLGKTNVLIYKEFVNLLIKFGVVIVLWPPARGMRCLARVTTTRAMGKRVWTLHSPLVGSPGLRR